MTALIAAAVYLACWIPAVAVTAAGPPLWVACIVDGLSAIASSFACLTYIEGQQ